MFCSRYMSCSECGAPVDRTVGDHACDPERRLDHQLGRLREETAAFEDQLATWLDSPPGRFAVWYAARSR